MSPRAAHPRISRQDLVVDLIDQAVLVAALYGQFRKFRGEGLEERAIFEQWDKLAETYLIGLRALREQAIASVWPEG